MALLREDLSDGRLFTVIEGFLKAGVLEEREWESSESGTPQGGVISPLLSNLYLDGLDHLMETRCGLTPPVRRPPPATSPPRRQ